MRSEAEKRIREALVATPPLVEVGHVRLMAACTPENVAALLAEIDRLRAAIDMQPGTPSTESIEWARKALAGTENAHAKWLREAAEQIRREGREGHAGWGNTCEFAAEEIDRLTRERDEARAERDAMAKDAERYRWLCDHDLRGPVICDIVEGAEDMGFIPVFPDNIDAAIDAQIEQERREQAKEQG